MWMVYPWGLPYNESMKRNEAGNGGQTLYIKNPAAHRLAAQISKRTGETLSDAVIGALEDKIRKTRRPIDRSKVDALCKKIAALPVLDDRPAEEILGYDDLGIPR